MDTDNIKTLAAIIILAIAVYTDIKERKIPDKLNIVAIAVGILIWFIEGRKFYYIISLGIAFIILMIITFITDGGIGGGDIKLMTILALYVGLLDWLILFLISLLSALIIKAARMIIIREKNNKSIIFAPYIFIGYISVISINYLHLNKLYMI